jgi:hypothetical protein
VKSLAKGVAINVGANKDPKWGVCRGPIFPNGSFKFIHIPWDEVTYGMTDPQPKKYQDMCYKEYVARMCPHLLDNFVAESPNFRISVYASSGAAKLANKAIWRLRENEDYLLFYATLKFEGEEEKRERWINRDWGAYIVGLFKIDRIWKRGSVLSNEYARKAFEGYCFYEVLKRPECFGGYLSEENECQQCKDSRACSESPYYDPRPPPDPSTPWVKGMEKESGLLEKAIPLSSPENSNRWSDLACELFKYFKTSEAKRLGIDKKAIPQAVLACEGECLDKLLSRCILRKMT